MEASPSLLLARVRDLNESGAFESASMLGGMLTSCANLRSLEPECLGAYADALMGLEEWRRASALYDRAEVAAHSLRRAAMKGASRASRGGAGGSGAAGAAAAELTPFHLVGSWKLGRARCLAKLGEDSLVLLLGQH